MYYLQYFINIFYFVLSCLTLWLQCPAMNCISNCVYLPKQTKIQHLGVSFSLASYLNMTHNYEIILSTETQIPTSKTNWEY